VLDVYEVESTEWLEQAIRDSRRPESKVFPLFCGEGLVAYLAVVATPEGLVLKLHTLLADKQAL
jgi:hypothetical protein